MQAHNWTIVIVTVETAAKYQYLNWGNEMKFKKKRWSTSMSQQAKNAFRTGCCKPWGIHLFPLGGWWQLVMNFMKFSKGSIRMLLGHDLTLHILYAQHFCSRPWAGHHAQIFHHELQARKLKFWVLKSRLSVWLTLDFPGMIPSRIIGSSNPSSLEPLLGKLYKGKMWETSEKCK